MAHCTPITVQGKRYPSFTAACEAYSVNWTTAKSRIKSGMSVDNAMRRKSNRIRGSEPVEVMGVTYESLAAACREFSQNISTVHGRLTSGWTLERALTVRPLQFTRAPSGRICSVCLTELVRRSDENSVKWRQREVCSVACSMVARHAYPTREDRDRLRRVLDAFSWRKATRLLGVCDKTMRRVLDGRVMRPKSLAKVRRALDDANETPA